MNITTKTHSFKNLNKQGKDESFNYFDPYENWDHQTLSSSPKEESDFLSPLL